MDPSTALIIASIISILPFVELRGAIPFALAYQANPFLTAFLCILFNILIIIPIFLFLDFLHEKFLKFSWYSKWFHGYLEKIRPRKEKLKKRIDSYGTIALALFVAVPLPITGAYTGSLLAWLLNINRKKAFFAIALGVLIAGVLVTLVSLGIITSISSLIK